MPDSILITLMGSLGDVARGLTLIEPLKNRFPETKITWLVEPKCFDLVSLHPQIDRIIVFKRAAKLSSFINLYKDLKETKFDLCLDLQRHLKSAFFSRLSGAKKVLGFDKRNAKEFNWVFSNEKIPYFPESTAKIEHYWKFLEYLDVPTPTTAGVTLNLGDENLILENKSLSKAASYLVLVLGSSWDSKDWPISGYHKLVEELSTKIKNITFVLTGGKEHYTQGQKLTQAFVNSKINISNLCGQTNLQELCTLIKNSKAVVGPDSGPGHLAAIFDIPFIGLFGPTSEIRTAPYGTKVDIISAQVGCRPCYRKQCPGLDKICMRMINPAEVANAVLAAI